MSRYPLLEEIAVVYPDPLGEIVWGTLVTLVAKLGICELMMEGGDGNQEERIRASQRKKGSGYQDRVSSK